MSDNESIAQSSAAPEPDIAQALSFLRKWPDRNAPLPFVHLVAIPLDPVTKTKGTPEGRSFAQNELDDAGPAAKWIGERNKAGNIYFTPNALRAPMTGKPRKVDVATVIAFHLDVDVPPGQDQESAARGLAEAVRTYKPEPTLVVASGGGVQAFWVLQQDDRIPVDGDVAKAADAECYTRAIEADFTSVRGASADACHNCDRVMRLPFSVNWPDAGKIAKGRKPALARLDGEFTDLKYAAQSFTKAPPKAEAHGKTADAIDWDKATEHAALYATELPDGLPPKASIILGYAGGTVEDLRLTLDEAGLLAQDKLRSGPAVSMALVAALKVSGKFTAEQIVALAGCERPCNSFGAWKKITCKIADASVRRHLRKYLVDAFDKAEGPMPSVAPPGALVLSEYDHMGRARKFADVKRPNVLHYRDDFVDYDRGRYAPVADATLRSNLYDFHDGSYKTIQTASGPSEVPFEPCTQSINETLAALKAARHVLPSVEQPCWRDGRTEPAPADVVSFPNGIYVLGRDVLLPPTPALFTPHAVGFDYSPDAAKPMHWIEFLNQIFDGDVEQINGWQEWCGYCISSDVSLEKAAMLLGPKRSGKDTTRHVLQSLLPAGAMCGPTLDSLATNFGMSQLINKQLAVVGDMRLGSKADKDLLAENVLKLTGRGLFTIDRKHKDHWTGSLPCKLLLISNEMPRIKDTSGALASRFITFNTRQSFYGKEDPNLFRDKLAPELPGIVLWALEGLRRVRQRGALAEPKNSIEQREQLARDGSPVLAFVDECLTLDPMDDMPKDVAYEAFARWAATNGIYVSGKPVFMRDLIAATGGRVRLGRKAVGVERVPCVLGARLSTQKGERHDAVPF